MSTSNKQKDDSGIGLDQSSQSYTDENNNVTYTDSSPTDYTQQPQSSSSQSSQQVQEVVSYRVQGAAGGGGTGVGAARGGHGLCPTVPLSYAMLPGRPGDPSSSFVSSSIHMVPMVMISKNLNTAILQPVRILIPESFSRAVIPSAKWMADTSECSIAVLEKQFHVYGNDWIDKMLVIFGELDRHRGALKLLLNLLIQQVQLLLCGGIPVRSIKQFTNDLVEDDAQTVSLRLVAFNSITGRLIGKLGKNLRDIMTSTDTRIIISCTPYNWSEPRSDPDRIVQITGEVDNVVEACARIAEKIQCAFEMNYKNSGIVPGDLLTLPPVAVPPQIPVLTRTQNLICAPQTSFQNVPLPGPLSMHCPSPSQYSYPTYFNHVGMAPNSPSASAVASSAISMIAMNENAMAMTDYNNNMAKTTGFY